MVDYVSLRDTAQSLLRDAGRSLKLQRAGTTPTDPSKPWRGSNAPPTSLDIIGVFDQFSLREIDGDQVKRGDKKVYVSHNSSLEGYTQLIDTKRGGKTWNIVSIEPVEPGDTTVLYILQVRQ